MWGPPEGFPGLCRCSSLGLWEPPKCERGDPNATGSGDIGNFGGLGHSDHVTQYLGE
jgi:hypothetical protein